MGISRRGNFMLSLHSESNFESQLEAFEAEWAAQWEPTVAQTYARSKKAVHCAQASDDAPTELEVVISLRSWQALKIRLVA
jgi:hypothetical protein